MADEFFEDHVVTVPTDQSIFEQAFAAYSVVLVGTRESDGSMDIAPKHMITPLGFSNYFGFVCTPAHRTYQNINRTEEFSVSYPRPEAILSISFSAEQRNKEGDKPNLDSLETVPATTIDADLVRNSYCFLECKLEEVSDRFGNNSFIAGEIVAQHVHQDVKRSPERDDNEIINQYPILTYLHPGRYAEIDDSHAFPFPRDFHR